jgi:hypothetical protein
MLDLMGRGNLVSDEIDIIQFEVVSKMLLSSMVLTLEGGNMRSIEKAWAGRSSGSSQQFLQQYLDLFKSIMHNDYMVGALVPVIFALETLYTPIEDPGQETYRQLCGAVIGQLLNCTRAGLFDHLARAIVACAKCGNCVDVAVTLSVIDIAQHMKDQYWVPRLAALFCHFDLSEDKVGGAALDFALSKKNGEFCAVEMLCGAGCWPTSIRWLLSLRLKLKERLGGLGFAQWDSCCMEQMYVHVLQTTGEEQEHLALLAKEVCRALALIYEKDTSIGHLGTWCKRGFSFCFRVKSNLLFNEYCLCPFAEALPFPHQLWLQSTLPVMVKEFLHITQAKVVVEEFRLALRVRKNPVPPKVQPKSDIPPGRPKKVGQPKNIVPPPASRKVQLQKSDIAHGCPKASRKTDNLVSHASIGKGKVRRIHGHLVCKHNRRQSMCKQCKGGSICEHGKQRHWCSECGGKARCPHGKQKSRCRLCGGQGICLHSRLRWRCTLCKEQ